MKFKNLFPAKDKGLKWMSLEGIGYILDKVRINIHRCVIRLSKVTWTRLGFSTSNNSLNSCILKLAEVSLNECTILLTLWCEKFLLLNFSMKILEKLPLCDKNPYEKSYLIILHGNQDIDNLRLLVFSTLHGYLTVLFMQTLQCIALCKRNPMCCNF